MREDKRKIKLCVRIGAAPSLFPLPVAAWCLILVEELCTAFVIHTCVPEKLQLASRHKFVGWCQKRIKSKHAHCGLDGGFCSVVFRMGLIPILQMSSILRLKSLTKSQRDSIF